MELWRLSHYTSSAMSGFGTIVTWIDEETIGLLIGMMVIVIYSEKRVFSMGGSASKR